jgi:predicted RNA methylase
MDKVDETFRSIHLVGQCMADADRAQAFERAIREVVRPGMSVLDIGTGSGLLAMMAARAGAGHVLAIERDPVIADVARRNIEENGFHRQVHVINGDASQWRLPMNPRPFDVAIIDLFTTGIIDQDQVAASNNLHRTQLINADTVCIPQRFDTHVQMGFMDFSICGFEMKMVRHLWEPFPHCRFYEAITERGLLRSESFASFIQPLVDVTVDLGVEGPGQINCVALTSETFLSPSVRVWDSLAMNAPVLLPVEPFRVETGDVVKLRLRYTYGSGFESLNLSVLSVQKRLKNVG